MWLYTPDFRSCTKVGERGYAPTDGYGVHGHRRKQGHLVLKRQIQSVSGRENSLRCGIYCQPILKMNLRCILKNIGVVFLYRGMMIMKKRIDAAGATVSVVMPAYNAEAYIEAAIRSVMNQTFENWELIVIDDGSRDATVDIVRRLTQEDARITLLQNEKNMGVSKTRNRGMDLAEDNYVAFLDSDDIWHPEKLESQLARMKQTGADFSYCSYAIVNVDGVKVKADYCVPEKITFHDLLKENVIGCSTVMLAPHVAKQYRFGSAFYHEDYVMWTQLLKDGYRACGNTEVLVDWRFIENSRSYDKRKAAMNRWRIYRKYLNLSLSQSIRAFSGYAFAGLRKYFGR